VLGVDISADVDCAGATAGLGFIGIAFVSRTHLRTPLGVNLITHIFPSFPLRLSPTANKVALWLGDGLLLLSAILII